MKASSCFVVLAFVLGLAQAAPARAAVALDDAQLAEVAGQGLDPTLLAALGRQEAGGLAMLAEAAPGSTGANGLDALAVSLRQLEQMQQRTAAVGVQEGVRIAQVSLALGRLPLQGAELALMSFPVLGLPLLGALAGLPGLPSQVGSGVPPKH